MRPAQRADLSFTSSGRVTAVNVAVGDVVEAGQALAAIDPTDLQAAVDAAVAAVEAARQDVTDAQRSGTEAAVASAKSTLKVKENDLAAAREALAAGTLTAPFAGTVAIVNVAVGQDVEVAASSASGSSSLGSIGSLISGAGIDLSSLGSSTSSGTSEAAITVVTVNHYLVETAVGSTDVGKLAKGNTVRITPEGTDRVLTGKVTAVGVLATGSTDSGGAGFPVQIVVDGEQDGLYAGISATLEIVYDKLEQVVAVPMLALSSDSAGEVVVKVKSGSGYTARPVEIGDLSSGMAHVLSGLEPGDVVQVLVEE
jgi:macrolide-specific efflux system membrane fusion protein